MAFSDSTPTPSAEEVNQLHTNSDVDKSRLSQHHTLGTSATQASPGNHNHDGITSVKIKATDIEGDIPAANGLPPGGLDGQILAKDSDTDYDTVWIDNFTPQVKHLVKNGSGAPMTKGQVVYISGADGTNMLVSLADADMDATSATTIGLLEQDLAVNAHGYVITEGLLDGLDTSMAAAGDAVWLSSTPGGKLYGVANKPVAPVHLVYLGVVTRVQSHNGEIFVSVNNGWEIDELHNVLVTSVANGDLLKYDSATSLWKNAAQSTLTIAPSQVTGTAVITTDPRLSDARTPTAHAITHISTGSDPLFLSQAQITGLTTALAGKASTTHASTHASGGSDPVTIDPSQVTGTAVITTDSRLSDARTPTAHASTHGSGGSDPVTIAQSQVTGLTTALAGKASTTHASTHASGGSDPITIAQSQVTNLVSDLSNKATFNHSHGYISNTGTVATPVTATNPVKVVITDSTDTVGTLLTTGASSTTFLRGDGTWNTPVRGYVGSFQTTDAASSSAISLAPVTVSTTPASDISIVGGATTNTAGNAGEVYITGGASTTGTGLSSGGNVTIRGGASNTTNGSGGNVTINGGQGSAANGNGSVNIGTTTTDSVTVTPPLTVSGGVSGALNLLGPSSPLQVQGSAGTAGTVLTSAGAGATPTWTAAPTAAIKVAANRTTSTTGTTALAINAQESFAITFPSGRFSVIPSVTASTSSVRYVAAVTSVTTSGFTLFVRNVSDASGTTYTWHWQAIEIVAGMGN